MNNRGAMLKLILLAGVSVIAVCGMGVYGNVNGKKIYGSVDRVRLTAEEFQRGALEVSEPLNELRQLTLKMVMAPNRELQLKLDRQQRELSLQLRAVFEDWRLDAVSQGEKAAFENLRQLWLRHASIKDFTAAKVLDGYREEAFINAIEAEDQSFQRVIGGVQAWQNAIIRNAEEVDAEAKAIYSKAYWVSTIVLAAATLFLGGFGYATVRMIIGPIDALKSAAARISRHAATVAIGDALDERIEVRSRDELGALARAFNLMVENLSAAMHRLNVQEKRTQAILNSTADGILTIDAAGQVSSCNAAAAELLKCGAEEVIGRRAAELAPVLAGDNGGELRLSGDLAAGRESETYCLDKQGRQAPIAIRVTEMRHSGERLYIATLQDIAERKRTEEDRRRILAAIRDTVSHLASASVQITSTMTQQSRGTERQAEAVSCTVAAVEEADRTAKESALAAHEVAETARSADDVGKAGRKAVEETRLSMDDVRSHVEATAESIITLAERAQAIGEIITSVNDIAEQTNVLALNAAIEASRAGDAGKGFAVVAAEVKSLAEQAKNLTGQVRQILSEIQEATKRAVISIEQGTRSAGEANIVVAKAEQTIEELGTMVGQAAEAASKIVAASSQQAGSMSQVRESMREIDQTARHVLESTRQTELAAKDLNALGKRLEELLAGAGRGAMAVSRDCVND